MIHSTILANLGAAAETRRGWAATEHYHHEALRLRREVADARGVLRSLHALGRAQLGGDRDEAERYFTEAEQLAVSLGETLERAKSGTPAPNSCCVTATAIAPRNAPPALMDVHPIRTRYDITHAQVTLGRVRARRRE